MADAAQQINVPIELSMPLPSDILSTLEFPMIDMAVRLSPILLLHSETVERLTISFSE